ncbi:MAG: VanW family protein [Coriobacteriales bacterium]|jgi:vancomycin resistance protein YoaR
MVDENRKIPPQGGSMENGSPLSNGSVSNGAPNGSGKPSGSSKGGKPVRKPIDGGDVSATAGKRAHSSKNGKPSRTSRKPVRTPIDRSGGPARKKAKKYSGNSGINNRKKGSENRKQISRNQGHQVPGKSAGLSGSQYYANRKKANRPSGMKKKAHDNAKHPSESHQQLSGISESPNRRKVTQVPSGPRVRRVDISGNSKKVKANGGKKARTYSPAVPKASRRGTSHNPKLPTGSPELSGADNLGIEDDASVPGSTKKHTARNIVIVVIVVIALFFCIDAIGSAGKIHNGVKIGTLDVGGMTEAEAAELVNDTYGPIVENSDILMYASEADKESTDDPVEITFDYETLEEYNTNPPEGASFTISPGTIGATVDGEKLADEAYQVGRGTDFFTGRIMAGTVGVSIDVSPTMDDSSVSALEMLLTRSLGEPMVNPGIKFSNGKFTVTEGNDGYVVNESEFEADLVNALMSDERSFVIPMQESKMEVDSAPAEEAAKTAQDAISDPVTLKFESASWELDSDALGGLVSTFVEKGSMGNELVPYISLDKVESYVPTLEDIGNLGKPAENVQFSYDGEKLSYVEGTNGIVPDYYSVTKRMNAIVFGDETLVDKSGEEPDDKVGESKATDTSANDLQRVIEMQLVESYPEMTYEDAHKLGLDNELIGEYRIEYSNSSSNKVHNIKLLSSTLTNTVIAPGDVFSINEIAGECNEEKGYKEAGSIVSGDLSSEIGGGICQVASTIFDTAYYAGYPIVERHNHSRFISTYPDGLDAAISWPYLDLKFQNDTDNYLLLLLDCDDTGVTCSLWGISPHRKVESEVTNVEEGEEYSTEYEVDESLEPGTEQVVTEGHDGHITTVVRKTYDSSGNLISEDTFVSDYLPENKVIVTGPDQ